MPNPSISKTPNNDFSDPDKWNWLLKKVPEHKNHYEVVPGTTREVEVKSDRMTTAEAIMVAPASKLRPKP